MGPILVCLFPLSLLCFFFSFSFSFLFFSSSFLPSLSSSLSSSPPPFLPLPSFLSFFSQVLLNPVFFFSYTKIVGIKIIIHFPHLGITLAVGVLTLYAYLQQRHFTSTDIYEVRALFQSLSKQPTQAANQVKQLSVSFRKLRVKVSNWKPGKLIRKTDK